MSLLPPQSYLSRMDPRTFCLTLSVRQIDYMLCSGLAAWISPDSFVLHNSFLGMFFFFLAFISLNTKGNDWQLSRVCQKRDSQRNSGRFKGTTFTACCKMIHSVPLNELLWSSLGSLICPWSSKAAGKSSGKGWKTPFYSSFAMKVIPHTSFLTDVPLTDVPFLVLQIEYSICVYIS